MEHHYSLKDGFKHYEFAWESSCNGLLGLSTNLCGQTPTVSFARVVIRASRSIFWGMISIIACNITTTKRREAAWGNIVKIITTMRKNYSEQQWALKRAYQLQIAQETWGAWPISFCLVSFVQIELISHTRNLICLPQSCHSRVTSAYIVVTRTISTRCSTPWHYIKIACEGGDGTVTVL